jgi:tetratricopeptide (TPR) repeat protein
LLYLNFAHIKAKPRFSLLFSNPFGGGFSYKMQNRGYKKSLMSMPAMLGKRHPELAQAYYFMGAVYAEKGDYGEALRLFQQALIANVEEFEAVDFYENPPSRDFLNEYCSKCLGIKPRLWPSVMPDSPMISVICKPFLRLPSRWRRFWTTCAEAPKPKAPNWVGLNGVKHLSRLSPPDMGFTTPCAKMNISDSFSVCGEEQSRRHARCARRS